MTGFGGGAASQHGISQAVRWYLERALVDDGQAAFHLGKIYEHGWGVEVDFAEAIKWYQRASLSDDGEAKALADALQSRLGEMKSIEKPNQLAVIFNRYGLPGWLAHPAVIVSVVIVVFWPLFFWGRKGRRGKNEIQEI